MTWNATKHEEQRAEAWRGIGADVDETHAMLDEIERLQAAVTVLTTDIGSLRGDGP